MKEIIDAIELQPGDAFDVCLEVYSKPTIYQHRFSANFTSIAQKVTVIHRNPPLSLPPFTPCAVEIECVGAKARIVIPGPTLVEVDRGHN